MSENRAPGGFIPRAPQSPMRSIVNVQNKIVSLQTGHTGTRRRNVQSNRFTSHLAGRFLHDTTLDGTTHKRQLEEKRERAKQALSERDRNVNMLEEEVKRVKQELEERANIRERRNKRLLARKQRQLLYTSALRIQRKYRSILAIRELNMRRTVQKAQFRSFAAMLIQHWYRTYVKGRRLRRSMAAARIQRWVRTVWTDRETRSCQELWGALSLQKLYRGHCGRRHARAHASAIAHVQRYVRGFLVRQRWRAQSHARLFCQDLFDECIDHAVEEAERDADRIDSTLASGNGFNLFLTSSVTPKPTEHDRPIIAVAALNLKGLKDTTGKPKYQYMDEFLDKSSEFSQSWREQLNEEEARFNRQSGGAQGTTGPPAGLDASSSVGVVNVIRGLRKMKGAAANKAGDPILEARIAGMAKVAEAERKRLEWVREQSKKNAKKIQKQEEMQRQHDEMMEAKRQKEKEEREERFKRGMKEMRDKLKRAVAVEKEKQQEEEKEKRRQQKEKETRALQYKEEQARKEQRRRAHMRKLAAKKERERQHEEEEYVQAQLVQQEEELQRQLELERKNREEAYRRQIRATEMKKQRAAQELEKRRQMEEEEAAKTAARKEHTKIVRAQIQERLALKKKKEKALERKAEKEARESMAKKLKLEEEARRRMELSAAIGLRAKAEYYNNNTGGMKKNHHALAIQKSKKGKKNRKAHSAGQERGGSILMRAAQAMGIDESKIPALEKQNHRYSQSEHRGSSAPRNVARRKEDVKLLPKRRKKESMSSYLTRATRVFENIAEAEAVDDAQQFEHDLEAMRRKHEEPVLAFVERARSSLESHPEYRSRMEERRQRAAMISLWGPVEEGGGRGEESHDGEEDHKAHGASGNFDVTLGI